MALRGGKLIEVGTEQGNRQLFTPETLPDTEVEWLTAHLADGEQQALAMFSKGEKGFKDRDLYPFCGGQDGMFTAHPSLVGKSLKELKDKTGKPLGEEIYKNAQEGKIGEVAYMWPRPGTTEPVKKVSFITKVGDQVCAVGYYQ